MTTQQGRSVGGATTQCTRKATTPCDPVALAVATRYEKTPVRNLVTTRRLRGPVRGAPPDVAPLLRQYDFVIDTIAGYTSSDDSAPKAAVVVAASTKLLGRCSFALHPRVTVGEAEGINTVRWSFNARPLPMDRVPQSAVDIMGFFVFLVGLWPGRDAVLVPVRAVGCGRRAPGAGAAVGDLNAVVRVFRAGKWTAKITLPPTGTFTLQRLGTQSERAARAAADAARAANTNVEKGWSAQAYAKEVRTKLSVSLKRNDVEVPAKQRITQLISAIANFRDTATRIFVLLQSFPQFGFRFDGSISVLEGSLEVKWEPELISTPECGGRYLPVRTKIEVKANLKLFDVQAAISFGMLAESEVLRTRLEARIEGRIGLSVSVYISLPLAARPDPVRVGVTSRGFVRARAVGNATLFGKTLASINVQVEGAIALKNGVVSISQRGIGFRGTLATEEVNLEVEASLGGIGPTKVTFEIFKARELRKWNEAE